MTHIWVHQPRATTIQEAIILCDGACTNVAGWSSPRNRDHCAFGVATISTRFWTKVQRWKQVRSTLPASAICTCPALSCAGDITRVYPTFIYFISLLLNVVVDVGGVVVVAVVAAVFLIHLVGVLLVLMFF